MIKPIRSVKCAQFGIKFSARGVNDPHVCVQIIIEDDGNWSPSMGDSFSSFWIPDLIAALEAARDRLDKKAVKQKDGFGWRFRRASEQKVKK